MVSLISKNCISPLRRSRFINSFKKMIPADFRIEPEQTGTWPYGLKSNKKRNKLCLAGLIRSKNHEFILTRIRSWSRIENNQTRGMHR